jgi:hypothetical protein
VQLLTIRGFVWIPHRRRPVRRAIRGARRRGGCAAVRPRGKSGANCLLEGRRILGLKRRERAQRSPDLGLHRAAIAQQRREGPRPIAVADQGEAGAARLPARVAADMRVERLDLDPVRP